MWMRDSIKAWIWVFVAWALTLANYENVEAFDRDNEIQNTYSQIDSINLSRRLQDSSKDLVLILVCENEYWKWEEKLWFSIDTTKYITVTESFSTIDELFNTLRDYSLIQHIKTLIIITHWDSGWIWFWNYRSLYEYFSTTEAIKLKWYQEVFAENWNILLYSCETWKWDHSFWKALSKATKTHVSASPFPLGFAYRNPDTTWSNIIEIDGRLMINEDKFALVSNLEINSDSIPLIMRKQIELHYSKIRASDRRSLERLINAWHIESVEYDSSKIFKFFENWEQVEK